MKIHLTGIPLMMAFIILFCDVSIAQNSKNATDRQWRTVSGHIADQDSGEPLIGAALKSEADGKGTVSNNYGYFSLKLPKGKVELVCSYVGYENVGLTLDVRRDTVLNFNLKAGSVLKEASVTAQRSSLISKGIGAIDISVDEIRSTPTLLGEADILKTLQLLPGVQSGTNGFTGLFVRGGGPDENLLMLDGTALYNANHMLGIFSVFMPESVKKVTLHKGAFPARYGGRISSVVDVRTNDGNLEKHQGTVSVNLLSSKVHFEGPMAKGKASYSVSGRLMNTIFAAPLIKALADSDENYNYWFYDANGKLTWNLSDADRLYLNIYNGLDKLTYNSHSSVSGFNAEIDGRDVTANSSSDDNTGIRWGNTLVSGRWNHIFGSGLFSNTTVAYNRYKMATSISNNENLIYHLRTYPDPKDSVTNSLTQTDYDSGIRDLSLNTDFEYTPSTSHQIRFGAEYIFHTYHPENLIMKHTMVEGGLTTLDTTFRDSRESAIIGHDFSVYAEDEYSVTDRLTINPGLRVNLFYVQGKGYLSAQPRLMARYGFNGGVAVKAGYSRMSQNVHLLSSSQLSLPTDLWVPVTKKIKPVISDQYCLGVSYDGLKKWEMSLEVYYKTLKNVIGYTDGSSLLGGSASWQEKVVMGQGRSMGAEMFIRKYAGKTTGWLSYTLGKTERRFPDGSVSGKDWFPYKYDRRHNLALVLNHKFGKKIDLNGTWTFATGGTLSIPERTTVILTPDSRELNVTSLNTHRGNYRLPSSHCLSVGVNFRHQGKHGESVWNVTVYNAYNRKNPDFVILDSESEYYGNSYSEKVQLKKITALPVIPSIGYTFNF